MTAETTPLPTAQTAVVVKQTGNNWTLEINQSYPLPPLSPGQALIRLTCTGVCHSDLSGINGSWDRQATCSVPGHEGVGRILAYHPSDINLSTLPPLGSKVGIPLIRKPCGACDICCLPDGEVMCPHTAFHGMQSDGTYQQYITIWTSYLIPIPEDIDDSLAAPVLCGGVTSYKAIKKSGARAGDWLVVAGAGGGLGSFAVQYAVAMGVKVLGIDTGDEKGNAILSLGAKAYVDYRVESDVPKRIVDITAGGAHAVLVIAPSETTYNQALGYTRVQGCVVCVGLPHEDVKMSVPPGLVLHRDLTIKGSMVGTRQDIAEALDFVVKGLVKPRVVVHPIEDISDIFHRMERNEILGRAVLKLS